MDEKLNPCPWCGNKNVYLKSTFIGFARKEKLWAVVCPLYSCNRVIVNWHWSKEEAIKEWNELSAKSAEE